MTTATFAPSRPGVLAGGDELNLPNPIAQLRRAWATYRDYRKTLAELRAMTVRQHEDLGIAGLDLKAVAQRAIYGI